MKFFTEHLEPEELQTKDDLFTWDQDIAPSTSDEIRASLKNAYKARGGSLHRGEQFPVSSRISLARVPSRELAKHYFGGDSLPPIEWMERVANLAITRLLKSN